MTAGIIVAAGSSRRMGFDKLMAEAGGQSVLSRSIRALLACEEIDLVVVVAEEERFNACGIGQESKPILRCDGGAERQDSVAAGLRLLPDEVDLVAIHDGARPLVSTAAISAVIRQARECGAASLAHPITDTLMRGDEMDRAVAIVPRDGLWAMETPQCFRRDWLEEAYDLVAQREHYVTDEVSALRLAGHSVQLVHNPEPNPKVTFPGDLELVNRLLGE